MTSTNQHRADRNATHPNRASTLALCVFCISLALLQGCKKKVDADDAPASTEAKPIVTVQATHPELGSITENIQGDATLAPIAQSAISSKVSSPVKKFYVQRGSRVRAGQLVAVLENQDLAAAAVDNKGSYQAAQGAYNTATGQAVPEEQVRAQTDLQQAKSTLDLNQSILTARSQLLAQGAIPGRDVDTARAQVVQSQAAYDVARQKFDALQRIGRAAAIESAKGTLESAKGKYLGAEAQLSYTELRSPIPGVVTDRPLFPGETAAAGTAVVTVMDTSTLIAKMHLAQRQAQELALGAPASITIPGVEEPIAASVSLISPAVDPGSTTVEVWLRVPNRKGTLRAGSAVHASIKGRTFTNALLIPTEAVQRSPEGAGKIVMIIAPDGTSKKRSVTVGISTTETTQILEGLKPEDMVITGGGYGLDEGSKVKIGPAEAKDADDAKAGDKGAADDKADPADKGAAADKIAPAADDKSDGKPAKPQPGTAKAKSAAADAASKKGGQQ